VITWVAGLTTVFITPKFTYDPINLPKMAMLIVGASATLVLLGFHFKSFFTKPYRAVLIVTGLFVANLTVVLFFSGGNFNQEFFGTNGRNTGYLSYVALSILLIAAVVASSKHFLVQLSFAMLCAGVLSTGYGLLQVAGKDPLPWASDYNPVIGFLGNPDFQSAFLGFACVLSASLFLTPKSRWYARIPYVVYILLSLFVIRKTGAQQGFLVFLAGGVVIVFVYIYQSRLKILAIPYTIIGLVAAYFVTMGSLNKGPLAPLLFKDSVTYRGDYWHAAWKMTIQHPWLGVGLDSYGDWYRRSRTMAATVRRGPDVISNASHNVLLDLSSNGGFPLIAVYMILFVLVIVSAIRVIRRNKGFNAPFTALFSAWVAYQSQSIISLNQLGLAVWGWILSGAIIGYEICSRDPGAPEVAVVKQNKRIKVTAATYSLNDVSPQSSIAILAGVLVGLVAMLPPVLASTKYLDALGSKNVQRVQAAAYIKPLDPVRMTQISVALAKNNFLGEGLSVARDSVKTFPDDYISWRLLYTLPGATPEEKATALARMKYLDPNNTSLK